MKSSRLIKFALFALVGFLAVYFSHPLSVFAQSATDTLATVGAQSGLSTTDPRIVVARVIRIGLGLIGIVAVVLAVYAGYLWMTAAGDAGKVDKAKRILLNALLGLIIIFASLGIVTFIINALLKSTGATGTGTDGGAGGGGGGGLGGGGTTAFIVTGFQPQGEVCGRNIVGRMTFSRALDAATVASHIQVLNADTATDIAKSITVSGNTAIIEATAPCDAPNQDRFCFPANTSVSVQVVSGIRSAAGTDLVCSTQYPCAFTFKTNNDVDVLPPTSAIQTPYNGQRFPVNASVEVQDHATDDCRVATVQYWVDGEAEPFDEVPADGVDLKNVFVSSFWDPSLYAEDKNYSLKAVAYDIAGNSASSTVSVHLNPAYCYNHQQDQDKGETGVDCGGACGACSGGSCGADTDCANGRCINGSCVDKPVITAISPGDGAPTNYVLITGTGFGGLTGDVYFSGDNGVMVKASLPSCGPSWSNTSVLVEIPQGAIDGPIVLKTYGGQATDATNDANGPFISDFDVNTTNRPGLCNLTPNTGAPRATVTATGHGFGDSQGNNAVYFDREAGASFTALQPQAYQSWSDKELKVTVPALPEYDYLVTVTQGDLTSNPLPYHVRFTSSTNDQTTPKITDISPTSGPIGQYLVIKGTNFGTNQGQVFFVNKTTQARAQGDIVFPAACSPNDIWSQGQIIVKVPSKDLNGAAISTGQYSLSVQRVNDGISSDPIDFSVTDGAPGPGLCAIDPNEGQAGTKITAYGEHFGSTLGKLIFPPELESVVTSWSDGKITATAPNGGKSGKVYLKTSTNQNSPGIDFAYGTGVADNAAQSKVSGYGWRFSTGQIPVEPQLVMACDGNNISAVPNISYNATSCLNVKIHARFNTLMDETTMRSNIYLEKCLDDSCSRTEKVTNAVLTVHSGPTDNPASFTWFDLLPDAVDSAKPNIRALPDTLYRVVVTTGVKSAGALGMPLSKQASWQFRTGGANDVCTVSQVFVEPSSVKLTSEGEQTEFSAYGVADRCLILGDNFDWSWSDSTQVASLASGACKEDSTQACVVATAVGDGVTDVKATEPNSLRSDSGQLTVEFSIPKVSDQWPSCTSACRNAEVGASFSTPIEINGNHGISLEGNALLYECSNELCLTDLKVAEDSPGNPASVSCTLTEKSPSGESGCSRFAINYPVKANAYYRVRISGQVQSTSGRPLAGLNDGDSYSWTFKTSEAECAVSSIIVDPGVATANAVGELQPFVATPLGVPDSCSAAGQRLNSSSMNWVWPTPVSDANVSEWVKLNDQLIDVNAGATVAGCTISCLPSGSKNFAAVCGNDKLDIGEECEDGNNQNGDGCSANCLNEGSELKCGDGTIQLKDLATDNNAATLGVIGEECDDSNTDNGDGCSNTCLNEGSNSVGATCGNRDLAYASNKGGEDCDDGNRTNNDGCSADCLHDGSVTRAQAIAVCGDGTVTGPYESCDDDGTANGDGCTSSCVREGFLPGASVIPGHANSCGNGVVDQNNATGAGEDCDTADPATKVGCTSTCTFAGSAITQSGSSVCGDGITGPGEYSACENTTASDSKIDPSQVAKISSTAPTMIPAGKNFATSTIHASIAGVNVTPGQANYRLQCGAVTDNDCANNSSNAFGVGLNNCCALRPLVATINPANNTAGICRNALPSFDVSQEVSADTIKQNVFLKLNLASGASCPTDHKVLARQEELQDRPFLAMTKRLVEYAIPTLRAQVAGNCVMPLGKVMISKVTNATVNSTETHYNVSLYTGALLAGTSNYSLIILGDNNKNDAIQKGLMATSGAHLAADNIVNFTTGERICALNYIKVEDPGQPTGYFANSGEQRDFTATAFALENNIPQAIQPTPGYTWTWNNWTETSQGKVVTVSGTGPTVSPSIGTVKAGDTSGQSTVIASVSLSNKTCSAGVNKDKACTANGDCGGSACNNVVVNGSLPVTAFFCDNPWPSLTTFPFHDSALAQSGAVKGNDWTYFSTYYCRDAGKKGMDDDLPKLTVVAPPAPPVDSPVIKEYLFEVTTPAFTGDVIGLRVANNPKYLSPEEWYADQGFTGSPNSTTIDGFSAVRDGRTIYVSAARQEAAPGRNNPAKLLKPYIYILSYNQDAHPETEQIFEQILANWHFLITTDSTAVCSESEGSQACNSDLDCLTADGGSSGVCLNDKAKITRDLTRITALTSQGRAIDKAASIAGHCSATTDRVCQTATNCPTGETCQATAPVIQSGTYIPGLTASTWPSWSSELGKVIGGAPVDPLNAYNNCPVGADPKTCYNQTTRSYACLAGSYVYHYQTAGSKFLLQGELEYAGGIWDLALPTYSMGSVVLGEKAEFGQLRTPGFVRPGAFCSDWVTYGQSSTCGDGIVGSGEVCEPGHVVGTSSCTLSYDANNDGQSTAADVGKQNMICSQDCKSTLADPAGTCSALSCGNGVVESSEQCDAGKDNGRYGFCGLDCTYASAAKCGDGLVAAGEACDCGFNGTPSGIGFNGGVCGANNGQYSVSGAKASCAWDCQGAGPFCGDKLIQNGEQCDGNSQVWDGALCADGSKCGPGLPACATGSCGAAGLEACGSKQLCLAGDPNLIGHSCSTDSACDSFQISSGGASVSKRDGQCSTTPVPLTRTRTCAAPGTTGACQYGANWSACTLASQCGNGSLEAGEECDDGNRTNGDSCTNTCRLNVCGDGYINTGIESCDAGNENGIECTAGYGSTCSYCSKSCRQVSKSGAFCGDGVRQASIEFCDGGDTQYTLVNKNGDVSSSCTVLADVTKLPASGGNICAPVGLCDGGPRQGQTCVESAYAIGAYAGLTCGTGTCAKPTCSKSCQTACPFTYQNTNVSFLGDKEGAVASSSITLSNAGVGNSIDANISARATLLLPACTVGGSLIADVTKDIEYQDTYIIFATDLSDANSGRIITGTTTIWDTIKLAIIGNGGTVEGGIPSLLKELTTKVHIAFVGYGPAKSMGSTEEKLPTYDYDNDGIDDQIGNAWATAFYSVNNMQTLIGKISNYTTSGNTTYTGQGLLAAGARFNHVTNSLSDATFSEVPSGARKIVILMAGGFWGSINWGLKDPAYHACVLRKQGIEVYTVSIADGVPTISPANDFCDSVVADIPFTTPTTPGAAPIVNFRGYKNWENLMYHPTSGVTTWSQGTHSLLKDMTAWSSGNPAISGIDYAYNGTTATDIMNAYTNVISSIKSAIVHYTIPTAGGVGSADGALIDGNSVVLPWPVGFKCDPVKPSSIPFTVSFNGTGTVRISNLRFNYCSP